MKIALHDSDRTRFPNLPLMKLSAWHRTQKDAVERFIPLMNDSYDRVYSSKVFSFTAEEPNLPRKSIARSNAKPKRQRRRCTGNKRKARLQPGLLDVKPKETRTR